MSDPDWRALEHLHKIALAVGPDGRATISIDGWLGEIPGIHMDAALAICETVWMTFRLERDEKITATDANVEAFISALRRALEAP